jgi:hypothetical protein
MFDNQFRALPRQIGAKNRERSPGFGAEFKDRIGDASGD